MTEFKLGNHSGKIEDGVITADEPMIARVLNSALRLMPEPTPADPQPDATALEYLGKTFSVVTVNADEPPAQNDPPGRIY